MLRPGFTQDGLIAGSNTSNRYNIVNEDNFYNTICDQWSSFSIKRSLLLRQHDFKEQENIIFFFAEKRVGRSCGPEIYAEKL